MLFVIVIIIIIIVMMNIIKFVPMITANILNCFLPKATEIRFSDVYLAGLFREYGYDQFGLFKDGIRKSHLGGNWYNKIGITTIAENHLNFSILIFFPLNIFFLWFAKREEHQTNKRNWKKTFAQVVKKKNWCKMNGFKD